MASSGNFNTYSPINVQGPAGPGTYSGSEGLTGGDTTQIQTSWVGTHFGFSSGKWYFEVRKPASPVGGWPRIGFYGMGGGGDSLSSITTETSNNLSSLRLNQGDDTMNKYVFGSTSSSSVAGSISSGDILQVAIDVDAGKIWYGVNDTYLVSGDPAGGSNAIDDYAEGTYNPVQVCVGTYNGPDLPDINFGQDSTFRGQRTAGGNADGNGFGDFAYSPPTGFLAMCSANLPTSSDIDPAETDDDFPGKQFNCVTYTGDASTRNITGVGFQPDLVITRGRSTASVCKFVDSTRGVTKVLQSHSSSAESTDSNGLTAFGTDGYTLGSDAGYNNSGTTYVGWCWRANGGTEVSNSDGATTTSVQANTAAGFSIVDCPQYSPNSTFGHGLNSAPNLIIAKTYEQGAQWAVYHSGLDSGKILYLNQNYAQFTSSIFNSTAPTSSVFSMGASYAGTGAIIAYCWHDVEGFSKFGKYEGNANNDGSFIYTGFRPRYFWIKEIDNADDWVIYDTARDTSNTGSSKVVRFEASSTEYDDASRAVDVYSNGFKLRTSNNTINAGNTYIYAAWGDVPFKYNNTF